MFLSKSSAGIYYLFYNDELGKRRAVSTRCRLKPQALKFLQSFKQADHERKTKLKRVLLSEFARAYIEHTRSIHTRKTAESDATALAEFLRIVGDRPLHLIEVRDIELFLSRKREEASAWTARKYYIALAAAFETAKRWGHISSNPFRSVDKPRVPEILPVFLSRTEFVVLLSAIPSQDLRDLVVCAVSSGLRLGELLALSWSDVDFGRRVLTIQNSERFTTKNRRMRVIPMNEGLFRTLSERRRTMSVESELVFHEGGAPCDPKRVSKAFKRSVRIAGLDHRLHFHSTRHTFASWLAQDGVSLYAIQKLLGHSSASVTQIYSHLQPSELRAEVERISVSTN